VALETRYLKQGTCFIVSVKLSVTSYIQVYITVNRTVNRTTRCPKIMEWRSTVQAPKHSWSMVASIDHHGDCQMENKEIMR
jgi:hypothetical protein